MDNRNKSSRPRPTYLAKQLAANKRYLKLLGDASEKKARTLVRAAPTSTLRFLGDIAYNLHKGRFPLTPDQHEYFRVRRKLLKQIGDPYNYTAKQRRDTLKQKGGNLSRALSKLVLSALRCPSQNHLAEAQSKDTVSSRPSCSAN